MNKSRGKFKNNDFGPLFITFTMPHLPDSEHNQNFPKKSERMILKYFSMPVSKHNFKKIYRADIEEN